MKQLLSKSVSLVTSVYSVVQEYKRFQTRLLHSGRQPFSLHTFVGLYLIGKPDQSIAESVTTAEQYLYIDGWKRLINQPDAWVP